MEHNWFPLKFRSSEGKDALQTAQKCCQKFNHFANVICSIHSISAVIYIMSEISFCSCNFDMGIPYTSIFFSESIMYKIIDCRFQYIMWD